MAKRLCQILFRNGHFDTHRFPDVGQPHKNRPRNSSDPFDTELSINDITQNANTETAVVFTDSGYELESAIPLEMLQIEELKKGQKIKCEFQINDADSTERDRLVHWMSEHDDPWHNASVWGRGQVTE